MIPTDTPERKNLIDRLYTIGITIKGIDGFIELVFGLFLLVSPQFVFHFLDALNRTLQTGQTYGPGFIVHFVAKLDADIPQSSLTFLIIFLITHGVVKLVLVYCLLREILWVYPYALGVLIAFFVYQLYVCIVSPSLGMAFLTILDAIIIWLVLHEYRQLRTKMV